jgi:hypothetical protein
MGKDGLTKEYGDKSTGAWESRGCCLYDPGRDGKCGYVYWSISTALPCLLDCVAIRLLLLLLPLLLSFQMLPKAIE